jgi:hypothetical protein
MKKLISVSISLMSARRENEAGHGSESMGDD